MKKLIAISIAAIMLLAVSGTANALSASETVGITLNLTDVFSLVVHEADQPDTDKLLELGQLDEGATGGSNLEVICGTNQGNAWTVTVLGEDLTNAGATETITVDNITFTPWAGGGDAGIGSLGTAGPMTIADQLVYTADPTEYSDTWVTVMCGVSVFVPYGTVSDYYGGDLTFTMTE